MRSPVLRFIVPTLLLAAPLALAAGPGPTDQAAARLSLFARGQVPATPAVFDDIDALGASGDPADIGLLRELAAHEGAEVAPRAAVALSALQRQIFDHHRKAFRADLPSSAAVRARGLSWARDGLPPTAAACAAYADLVVGSPGPSILALRDPDEAVLAAARFLGRGDVRAAVHAWARAATLGSDTAFAALPTYGVDAERLLLGLVAAGWVSPEPVLGVLARRGDKLTVALLAERAARPVDADPAQADRALDFLAGMVLADERIRPLSPADTALARKALQQAAAAPDIALSPAVRRALLADD